MGINRQIFLCLCLMGVFLAATRLEAAPYINGTVKVNGAAYTKDASVYLSCQGSNYSYCSDYDTISSSGQYSLEGTSEWNCCSSTNASRTWSSCQIYASQWNDQTVASSRYVDVSLDCDTTLTQDLDLTPKNKIIEITLKVGEGTLVAGMNVSCSQTSAPWTSSYITSSTNGVWQVPVTEGTFRCSAYCDWTTWQGACPYAGNPEKTVVVRDSDTTVSTSLDFSVKDKTIQISVYQGDTLLSDRISVYCNQQSSPYTSGSDSTASSGGTYDILVTEGRYYCYSYCNSSPCEDFSGNPSIYVDVGSSDSVVPATLRYQVRDKKIRTTLISGNRQITSGMSVYCNQQGGGWDYSNATYEGGVYTCNVGTGSYRVYAYCTDYNQCNASGNPAATVDFTSSDPAGTTADVTLVFLENDATLTGLVTDGSSGVYNVWVNANANSISGGSQSGTAALTYKGVTVSGGTADATQVYRSAQTDSSGAFTMTLPAGTYQISIYPPYDRSDLTQTSQEVTVRAGGSSTVVLTMQKKTASITVCLRDTNGNAVRGYINGWSHNGASGSGDYVWGQTTTSDACTDFSAVEGYTYNLSASCDTWSSNDTNLCNYTSEGMQSVAATRDGTTVNFTCPTCDCSMTVNLVDPDGEIVPLNGSVDCTPKSFSTGEGYHGIWGWSSSGTGVLDVASGVDYLCNAWIWSDGHTSSNETSCSCSDGASSCEITLAPVIEDCVSGSFLDSEEAAIETSGGSYFYVYASRGRNYKNCDITTAGYSCDLSEGTWNLCYSTQSSSGYASPSQGASCQDVTCGATGGTAQNLPLLETGFVEVTVKNLDGTGRSNVWVEVCPYSASQEGANSYQYRYGCGWGESDSDGEVTVNVGAPRDEGVDYYCNAYVPYTMRTDESLNNPEEQKVTVVAGQTATCDLQFETPDGSISISVAEGEISASSLSFKKRKVVLEERPLKQVLNASATDSSSPIAYATVDCFSPAGGSYQTTSDETGQATTLCSSDDVWYCVCYNIVGNALYMSTVDQVTCSVEGSSAACSLDFIATVPEGDSRSVTDAATQSITIELADGSSFSFPPGSLGDADESVTVTVDVVVTPFTPNKIPASFWGYFVQASDSNGVSIQQLNSPATLTLPINIDQVENLGLTEKDIHCSYFNEATGTYTEEPSAISTTFCTFDVAHLTDFAVVGNGFLGSVTGEDGGAIGKETDTPGDSPSATGDSDSDSGSGVASGCGCYLTDGTAAWDDRSLWVILFCLLGLLRRKNPRIENEGWKRTT